MVNDQEPRYRLVDSNGNVVGSLFQNDDGNVEIQDETGTGSVFGPNGIVTPAIDAESVNTEQLNFDDIVYAELIDEYVQGTGTDESVSVEFDGLTPGESFIIEMRLIIDSDDSEVFLRMGETEIDDGANYGYWDETGAFQADQTEILLVQGDRFSRIGGLVRISSDTNTRAGIDNQITTGRPEVISGFSQKGGWNNGLEFNRVEITSTGGLQRESDFIRIWRAV